MSRVSIRKEKRRLDRAFAAILATVAPLAAAAYACTETNDSPTPTLPKTPDASIDASIDVATSDDASLESATPGDDATADGAETLDGAFDASDGGDEADVATTKDSGCDFDVAAYDVGAEAEPLCRYIMGCGLPDTVIAVGCDVYLSEPDSAPLDARAIGCRLVEGEGCNGDAYAPEAGRVVVLCKECLGSVGIGRRVAGLVSRRGASSSLGEHFAKRAHGEAASVIAFEILAKELAAHGAPSSILRAIARARRDELRHARVMTRFAQKHGATVPKPRVRRRTKVRSLEAIARENAVVGCVEETIGALSLKWQSQTAPDRELREALVSIAEDEVRHAALSWAIARWIEGELDAAARRRVERARGRAFERMRGGIDAVRSA